MTINNVTVTIEATGTPGSTNVPEGNYTFCPDGVLYPAVAGGGPIVPAMVHGTLSAGSASAVLIASDNFGANILNWATIINIRGLPTIKASNLTINFADGATQDIWTILTNNGWIPVQLP
jgi:hypothetical protein